MTDTALPKSGPGVLTRNWRRLALIRESGVGTVGLSIIVFWCLMALLAPLIAPYPPNAQYVPFQVPGVTAPDGGTFWLGTDHLGRDILSRLMWGARTVLFYAPLATFCAYAVGIVMGLAAGYKRGWIDDVLSRVADIILSFPVLVLYVVVITTFGASGINIIIAVTFASAPGIMRIVRGLVLDLRTRDYVAAAQTRGESAWYIMFVEILPNARGPLIVDGCLRLGYVIITIGVLGFLGLGLPPPDPDWGGMVNETRGMAMAFPHMTIFPCIAISSLVLGFNLLADGLREISLRD
ncbi:ABC transporter permease [Oceanibaculum sp.]|uniref:ABC transporter permease n=1 Tax=Oceanibaculum sp. TaxID=1903597 RepID=UPI00258EF395|nr:ABC transporter permease [Oceanibaculum sp.]MCH2395031.1 ABC transporter permease [Oceanibaculum sp.]